MRCSGASWRDGSEAGIGGADAGGGLLGGAWDGTADGAIFLHCQTLEMERADAAGYRFASVNLGCNRPARLMPLVDEVIRLAEIGMVRGNWAAYR